MSTKRNHSSYERNSRSRARRHLQEAGNLTILLGGADKDVKDYFFNLPEHELEKIFVNYGKLYNRSQGTPSKPNAEQYARLTFHKWAGGTVGMSGQTAERLFNILPPQMSLTDKYSLIDKMWTKYSPRSNLYIQIGLDADQDILITKIKTHLDEKVISYKVPSELEQRFNWLCQNDATVSQQLLNHYLNKEKESISAYLQSSLPVIRKHFKRMSSSEFHGKITDVIKVGKHEVHLFFDEKASGICETSKLVSKSSTSTGKANNTSDNSNPVGCLSVIAIMIGLFVIFLNFS